MKDLFSPEIDPFRCRDDHIQRMFGGYGDHTCGAFMVPSCVDKEPLRLIISSGDGWDHVSVSRADRIPAWQEMEQIKRLIFKEDEVAMQLHVTPKNHINICENCLHLWRPIGKDIPLPPYYMV